MTTGVIDFARCIEEEVAAARKASVGELGPDALAWLVLPPLWTDALLDAIPQAAIPQDREAFLTKCQHLGWCRRRPAELTGQREDAAEILVELIRTLRGIDPDTGILNRAVSVAAALIGQAQVSAAQRSVWGRLIGLSAGDTARDPPADLTALSEPAGPDPAGLARELIASSAGPDHALLSTSRPADLQRTVLQYGHELPAWLLKSAVAQIVAESPPRAAARVLATAADRLPPEVVSSFVSQVLARLDPGERGTEPVLANLALAGAYGEDSEAALELCERLSDDLLRAKALAVLAGTLARRQDERHTRDVADRIARVVVVGEGVDLAGAADAVTRLAEAGAFAYAAPIIDTVTQRLRADRLSAPDIGALVRLATALRGEGHDASTFVAMALDLAKVLADPATRSAALARILPVAADSIREEMMAEALRSARDVTDATDRARALARLVVHLPPGQLGPVVDQIISALQPADPGSTFWVPDSARAGILDELERQKKLSWLRDRAREIGGAVRDQSHSVLVPPALRRWAVLAATLKGEDDTGDETGDALLRQVQPLLRSGFTAEALGWIETGRRLHRLVGGTFDTSLLVAARKVELAERTADDRRLLQRFLPLQEALDAFRDLLSVEDRQEPWALHYLGAGGLGKTMLLRHIGAELAPAEQLIVARIDFDHLSPDFPLKRPGQLLLDLLEELEVYANPDTRELYEDAHKVLLYQQQPPGGGTADVPPTLEHATERFCAYLEALGLRIVLILDTCEELARFEPAGAVLPQLEAALRLLERINREVPSVRVVFAGRRPLARRVHGGRVLTPRRWLDCLPDEKTYLAVHEVAGFTDTEARRYLSEMEGLTLDAAVVDELLDRSRSAPREPTYAGGPDPAKTARHIPFDLAQYAAALREDPQYLNSAQRDLAYAIYVRDRIADRLGPVTAQILPAVVAMRRFDLEMLAVAVSDGAVTSEEAWQELGTVEWITAHVDTVLKTTFLEVDRTMLERLGAYYAAPDQHLAYNRARQGLAGGLARLVRDRPPASLSVDHVDAALRCLPPEEAAELCDDLGLRVAADPQAWMWAYHVFSRVLGLDGALADPEHAAAAAAGALHATALSKVRPAEELRLQWQAVAGAAWKHPRQDIGRWLANRARVLAFPDETWHWRRAMRQVRQLWRGGQEDRRRAAWLVGTILAAAGRVMDAADGERPAPAQGQRVLREIAGHTFGPQVSVVANVLLARGLLTGGSGDEAADLFDRALAAEEAIRTARSAPGTDAGPLVPEAAVDGGVPDNLRDWVRLEAILADLPGVARDPDTRREWLSQALDAIQHSTDADQVADPGSDRLAALLLGLLLNEQPLPAGQLVRAQDAVGTRPPPSARTLAHRQVPALRVVLSRAWLALAATYQAGEVLGPRGAFAETAAGQRELDLARVEIARRMRLRRSDHAMRQKLRETCSPAEVPRVYEAMSLLGEGPPPPPELFRPPMHLHAWWHATPEPLSAVPVVPAEDLLNAFQVALQWCAPGQLDLAEALALDQEELRLLGGGGQVAHEEPLVRLAAGPGRFRSLDGDEQAWRQALRRAALKGEEMAGPPPGDPPPGGTASGGPRETTTLAGLPRLGTRRRAELALDEGELLALRLPQAGVLLLRAARQWFEEASDPVGALISHIAERLAVARSTRKQPDLASLETTYQRACREHPELPGWSDLSSEATYAEAVSAMGRQARRVWEGWLSALRWLHDGASTSWRGLDPKTTAIPPELGITKPRRPAGQMRRGRRRAGG